MNEQDWDSIKEDIFYEFTEDVYLSEAKDSEILRNRIDLLNAITPYVGTYFSREFIYSDVLHLSEDDVKKMQKDIDADTDLQQQMAMQQQQNTGQSQGNTGGAPVLGAPLMGQQATAYNPSNPVVEDTKVIKIKTGA